MRFTKEMTEQLESIKVCKVLDLNPNQLFAYFVETKKIFKTERDLKLFILESLPKHLAEADAELPIHYMDKDEQIPEDEKIVTTGDPMLTDNYINNVLKNES